MLDKVVTINGSMRETVITRWSWKISYSVWMIDVYVAQYYAHFDDIQAYDADNGLWSILSEFGPIKTKELNWIKKLKLDCVKKK